MSELSVEEYIRNIFILGTVTASPPDNPYIFTAKIDHVDSDTLNALTRFLHLRGYMNPLIDARPSGERIIIRVMLR